MGDLIDSINFSLKSHLRLIIFSNMYDFAVYVTSSFISFSTELTYRKLWGLLFMFLTDFIHCLTSFFLNWSLLFFVHIVWCYFIYVITVLFFSIYLFLLTPLFLLLWLSFCVKVLIMFLSVSIEIPIQSRSGILIFIAQVLISDWDGHRDH